MFDKIVTVKSNKSISKNAKNLTFHEQIKTLTPKVVREPPPEPKPVDQASIAIQMSENVVATPADHAYSSSVTNIEASHSRDASVTSFKSPPKRMKPVNTSAMTTPSPLQRTSSRIVSFQVWKTLKKSIHLVVCPKRLVRLRPIWVHSF